MYGFTIESIYNKLYPNTKKVLCRETAARYLGLSKGWGIPVHVYFDTGKVIDSEYFIGHKVDDLQIIPYINQNNIYCTTAEKTLCDLLASESCIQTLNQSLITYYYRKNGEITELLKFAESNGLCTQLQDRLHHALEYYDE